MLHFCDNTRFDNKICIEIRGFWRNCKQHWVEDSNGYIFKTQQWEWRSFWINLRFVFNLLIIRHFIQLANERKYIINDISWVQSQSTDWTLWLKGKMWRFCFFCLSRDWKSVFFQSKNRPLISGVCFKKCFYFVKTINMFWVVHYLSTIALNTSYWQVIHKYKLAGGLYYSKILNKQLKL